MQDNELEEAVRLTHLGMEAMNSHSENRLDNLQLANDYFQEALTVLKPETELAAEVRVMLARSLNEMIQLATSQMSKTQMTQSSSSQVVLPNPQLTLPSPQVVPPNPQTTLPLPQVVPPTYLTSIASAQVMLAEQTSRAVTSFQEQQDVMREVKPILTLKKGLEHTSERAVKGLAWLFRPLLVIFVLILIISLATPALLNWYFNKSSSQLCSSDTGSVTISASSFLQPFLLAAKQTYRQTCLNTPINIITTSTDGINQVDTYAATIGIAETAADTTQHVLLDNQVAIRILAIIVNEKSGVSELSLENIREIYSGSVGNWQDICHFNSQKKRVCGNAQGINIIGRPANSDIRAAFEQYVLGGAEYLPGTTISDVDSTPNGNGIVQDVMNIPGAIGYVALSAAQQAHITPIAIDGVLPSPTSIAKQEYKFWAVEHLYTRDPAADQSQKFIYFLHTNDGISLLHKYGFLSITDIPDTVLHNHG